jgi:NAD-dependent protein deacetylase/lipoamidase
MNKYEQAAEIIKNGKRVVAFTGAGISVESGIPPFRGKDGLWNKYDPIFIEIDYFCNNPERAWIKIKEIFYDFFGKAEPNAAHRALALMEERGLLQAVITQNIDNLHQEAGSKEVYEFHGNSKKLLCLGCARRMPAAGFDLNVIPPHCPNCGGLLKPDFVFFGEAIPEPANTKSFRESKEADIMILIGTAGEVMPAAMIPDMAKRNGASIIEVNLTESNYTAGITDIFLEGPATEGMTGLLRALNI